MRQIGPYSRPHILAKLDGRRAETRLLESTRKKLIEHVGGKPSAAQAVLIDRAAMLTLHMALMDRKMLEGEGAEGAAGMSKDDSDKYLAWSNTLARIIKQLGPKVEASKPQRTLADLISQHKEQAA